MNYLKHYLHDGANKQARAVLCFLQNMEIEESWNSNRRKYDAEFKVARWENCREQGYVIYLVSPIHRKQLNIAFFEHRNSDQICAIKWEQYPTLNSPTIDTAEFGDVYKNKYDVSKEVDYGEIMEMANWIEEEFTEWYQQFIEKNAE